MTTRQLNVLTVLWIIVLILAIVGKVKAQDDELYVCRDYDFEWVRLEFHNIPVSWDEVGWGYVALGASQEGRTLIADALLDDESEPYVAGQAAIFAWDGSELVGDANSPACEGTNRPPAEDVTMNGTEGGELRAVAGQCYLAYIDNGDGGESRVNDSNNPDGIEWKADEAGAVHLITGGGGQTTDAADYRLEPVACK